MKAPTFNMDETKFIGLVQRAHGCTSRIGGMTTQLLWEIETSLDYLDFKKRMMIQDEELRELVSLIPTTVTLLNELRVTSEHILKVIGQREAEAAQK